MPKQTRHPGTTGMDGVVVVVVQERTVVTGVVVVVIVCYVWVDAIVAVHAHFLFRQ
jgi:hypothetical protein